MTLTGGDNVIEDNTKLCTIGYSLSHFGAKRKDGYTDMNTYPDNRIVTGTNTSSPIEVEKAEVAPDYQYADTYLKVCQSSGDDLPPMDQHKFDYKTKSYLVKAIDVYVDSVSGSQKEEPSNGSFSKSINTDGLNSKIGIIISDSDVTLSSQNSSQCLINKVNNGQLSLITLDFIRSAGGSASIQFGYSDGRTNKDAIFYYDESSIKWHNTTGNMGYYSCKFKLSDEDYDISIKNSIKFAPYMHLTYEVGSAHTGDWLYYFNEPVYRTYSDTGFPSTSYGVINSCEIGRPMPHGTPINYTFNDMKQHSDYDVYYNDDYYGDVKIKTPDPEPVSTYEVKGLQVTSAYGSTTVSIKVQGAIVESVQGSTISYYFDKNENAIRHIDQSGYWDYIVFTKGSGSSNGTISIVNGLDNVPSGTFYLSIGSVGGGAANQINYQGNQAVQLKD